MDEKQLLITPQTKVGELLRAYPQLEQVLMDVTPAFKKLSNPILKRTVAKVTTLAQAARVGGVPVAELVQRLRHEVGQPNFTEAGPETESKPRTAAPTWYDSTRIAITLDARPLIDAGEHPIGRVLRELNTLRSGQIYELITPFEPAPLIDQAKERGFPAWAEAHSSEEFHTYFLSR